ncbi:hypothetical protein FOL47_002019 [Perkinsus chesapeaki]|uniref:Uncharacterized protein n=1 Tax=Perkinsus chesapeaki TaxID=330153 RepID=A0A7J6MH42_PERCH|nr:hypothetical protein FOL47_002019 [Perkinsus chesapeaki]
MRYIYAVFCFMLMGLAEANKKDSCFICEVCKYAQFVPRCRDETTQCGGKNCPCCEEVKCDKCKSCYLPFITPSCPGDIKACGGLGCPCCRPKTTKCPSSLEE